MPGKRQKILVAAVGVGLVGSEFVKQLQSIPAASSPFKLVALFSSSRALYAPEGESISATLDWKTSLKESATAADLKVLTDKVRAFVQAGEKVVVVDNTSSEDVSSYYPIWLEAGVNVATASKKGLSGDNALFEAIVDASRASGAKMLHESSVGAGLPVIAPLKELVATGDKV